MERVRACAQCGTALPNTKRPSADRVFCDHACYGLYRSRVYTGHLIGKFKHGASKTKMFRQWKAMLSRCRNKNTPGWKNYGGRGISVCDEWVASFLAFKTWADSSGYSESLELDRVNNDKGYSPNNCRWATHSQQARNKRNTKRTEENIKIARSMVEHGCSIWSIARRIGCSYCTARRIVVEDINAS